MAKKAAKQSPKCVAPNTRAVILTDNEGRVLEWDAGAEHLYGFSRQEALGRPLPALVSGGENGAPNVPFLSSNRSLLPVTFKARHRTKDGASVDVRVSITSSGEAESNEPRFSVFIEPVAESMPSSLRLWESNAWVRGVVEAAVDGIITISEDGIIHYMNPAALRMFGYTSEEILGRDVSLLMPLPDAERHHEYVQNYLRTRRPRIIGIGREIVGKRKDGSLFPLYIAVSEVFVDGKTLFTGILRDISEEKAAREQMRRLLDELQERNKKMMCLYRVGQLLRTDALEARVFEQVIEFVAEACARPDDARVRIVFDDTVYQKRSFSETPCHLSAPIIVNGRERGRILVWYMCDWVTQDNMHLWEEDQHLLEAVARTLGEFVERREAEAQIIQASKLASIGELAAGVSHEINNPVNGIINCADILLQRLPKESKEHQFAALIRAEADRIALIVRNLLTFSRQEREQHSPARLCDIVEAVLSLSRKKMAKSNIVLEVSVPETLPKIKCRSERIQQVLMNLLINAIHALDEKYPSKDPDKILRIYAEPRSEDGKEYLVLTVEDHGTGIAPAHRRRLFDPFFTTKGRDKGTGLGLSVSDGIIKDHGGKITFDTEWGKYTKFHVYLPLDNGWRMHGTQNLIPADESTPPSCDSSEGSEKTEG